MAIAPDGTFALVSNSLGHTVDHIDLSSMALVRSYGTFSSPRGLAIAADATFALVGNTNGNNIGRIDLKLANSSGNSSSNSSSAANTNGVVTFPYDGFEYPEGVAISPDSSYCIVANSGDDSVAHVDLQTGRYTEPYGYNFEEPSAVAISADGTFALVSNASKIARIDLMKMATGYPFQASAFPSPRGVAISPAAEFMLVTNHKTNSLVRMVFPTARQRVAALDTAHSKIKGDDAPGLRKCLVAGQKAAGNSVQEFHRAVAVLPDAVTGHTLLHAAAAAGHPDCAVEIVSFLLAADAPGLVLQAIQAKTKSGLQSGAASGGQKDNNGSKNRAGMTPAKLAARSCGGRDWAKAMATGFESAAAEDKTQLFGLTLQVPCAG